MSCQLRADYVCDKTVAEDPAVWPPRFFLLHGGGSGDGDWGWQPVDADGGPQHLPEYACCNPQVVRVNTPLLYK